jgi:serine/threonine-protein kinase
MNGDMIGRLIKGRYKLIDERGRGSFATVYIARDLQDNHIYAVKLMHLELSTEDELLARFQREAHILLNLKDPHIVRIFDYGNDSTLNFIAMDYIDGESLKYYMINDGPMAPLRALDYARQIAEGLSTANKQGVVHRDIKPQNILINTQNVVKLTDFGLARGKDMVTLTSTNVFMGTAYYIAPEQADDGRAADTRSDLYSTATVLFEMLTGNRPYEGETAIDIVLKHKRDKIPSICRLRQDLPAEADLFMQKALAKTPDQRFQTPQEFIAALEQLREIFSARPAVPVNNRQLSREARLVSLMDGRVFPLRSEKMMVGRQDPNKNIFPDIDLGDKTVGRQHAYLYNFQGRYVVEDLNTLNKTRVNEIVLSPSMQQTLNDGDIIRFGNVNLRFELR